MNTALHQPPFQQSEQCFYAAVIMSIATVEVMHEAIQALVDGLAHGESKDPAVLCLCLLHMPSSAALVSDILGT